MIYEVFEPDPTDEYYNEQCSAAWTAMFSSDYCVEDYDVARLLRDA